MAVCRTLNINFRKFDNLERGRCQMSWYLVGKILEYCQAEMFVGFRDNPKS